jgi:hypothetical protein
MDFMGEPTQKTAVVYLTEERDSTFREALRRAGLLDRIDLHVLCWRDTLGEPWQSIMEDAVKKCAEVGAELLAVDTISQFAHLTGDRENNAGDVLEVFLSLQDAAAKGLGVISIRHERKSSGDVADAGRGSSAFAGAADIILAIRRPEGNTRPTLREIHANSRFDETPGFLAIELTDAGYVALGDSVAVAKDEAKAAILAVTPTEESEALTLDELLKKTGVKRTVAQAAIKELREGGQLRRIGKGVKNDSHKWFAPTQIHSAATLTSGEAESIESVNAHGDDSDSQGG